MSSGMELFAIAVTGLLMGVVYQLEKIRQTLARTRYLVIKEHVAEPDRGE
jgi:hypothetical protein